VRRLTFDSASTFGLYDRGLPAPRHGRRYRDLRSGYREIGHEVVVRDSPRRLAYQERRGIFATMSMVRCVRRRQAHRGAPGRVLRTRMARHHG